MQYKAIVTKYSMHTKHTLCPLDLQSPLYIIQP